MQQDIERLARYIRQRRKDLKLSQEDIDELGGPSTTTLSKIELGKAKRVHEGTLKALDRALGWRAGSASDAVYGIAEPAVTSEPGGAARPLSDADLFGNEPEGGNWLTVRSGEDERGSIVIGTLVSTDPEGVASRLEVHYWPGTNRVVQMGAFPAAVTAAQHAALEATSVYRPNERTHGEEQGNGSTPATSQAGVRPAQEEGPVSEVNGDALTLDQLDEQRGKPVGPGRGRDDQD